METKISEKFLYHIWDGLHLKKQLKTVSGKKFEIIFQGRWNTAAGPDFKNATLKLDNKIIKGDIEIHQHTYDWKAHKHSEDSNFNRVILHAVYQHNSNIDYTIAEDGKKIEIFTIEKYLNKDIEKLLAKFDAKFTPKDKDCVFFAGMNTKSLHKTLTHFGEMRMKKKVKRFGAELFFNDFDNVLYQGLLEAFGYSKNKFQMLQLAQEINYNNLSKFKTQKMTQHELYAILLCSSGLVNHLPKTFPGELIKKWKELYAKQDFCHKEIALNWNLFRIRPANNPAIRLLQFANIVYHYLDLSLFHQMLKIFSFQSKKITKKQLYKNIESFFNIRIDFLPDYYRIGKTRMNVIFINILLPLAILYAQKKDYKDLENICFSIYQSFKKLPENYITKFMYNFMTAKQSKTAKKKAIYQQGLLKLYFEFCQHHNCDLCKNLEIL